MRETRTGPVPKRALARRLRGEMTDAERKLWWRLRDRRFAGHRFLRQVPIGPYVADFVCRPARLVVEVDGGRHAESRTDAARDAWLARQGHRVLRFWNHDVLRAPQTVLDTIFSALDGAADGKVASHAEA